LHQENFMKDCFPDPKVISTFDLIAEQENSQQAQSTIRVWLVDDNDDVRLPMADLLDKQPRLKAERQFSCAEAALEALRLHEPPQVVLLDLNLGSKSGIDAIRPFKAAAPNARILMFTTFFDTIAEAEAREAGATGFLLKSYDVSQVTELIQAAADDRAHSSFFSRASQRRSCRTQVVQTDILPCAARPGARQKRNRLFRSLLTLLAV
jgi:DNA-binding NarL/FixJ family response regulator